ncbi:FAD-dependent oxidoreductase [Fictibacillus nanhaiensis]|uniref:NAD(P)/FAD-dependent oxidoreductase n=1 Tax=Fictibacillus nanhaiensis TaxID=742169 RepID=UPI002E1D581F|nr:FAD-dependent oxidoreductase [Fictibacillus nanhaiensis]MED1865312.1 FAD-dependent oxidoreductase [Fictibacillus nanhaiensis]
MTKLLLIGGGHAHLSILRSLLHEKMSDLEITLITSSKFQYYSGMFSGFTEGLYDEDEIRIDLESLCSRASVSFIEDTIISFDPMQKVLLGFSGEIYHFDVISFDIEPWVSSELISTSELTPKHHFIEKIKKLRSSEAPVIVGDSSRAVELALSVSSWRNTYNLSNSVTLISPSSLLHSYGAKATKKIREIAHDHNLEFYENEQVNEAKDSYVTTKNGTKIKYSIILPITEPKASSLFKQALLPVDSDGFLLVEDTLQNDEYPYVFGAGNCVTISMYSELVKNDFHATKQGPILWRNIKRFLFGQSLESFKPYTSPFSIISTGKQQGLFIFRNVTLYGKWVWYMKNFNDQKFIKRHV